LENLWAFFFGVLMSVTIETKELDFLDSFLGIERVNAVFGCDHTELFLGNRGYFVYDNFLRQIVKGDLPLRIGNVGVLSYC
jgi:hypothetical protein